MLLSETELRAALEPLLDRLLGERLRLFQLQLEPRLQALIHTALEPRAEAAAFEGLEQIFLASDVERCFEALFEQCRQLTGPMRALLVQWRGELAVWRDEGLRLPERIACTRQDTVLRGLQRRPIAVRGRAVGQLCWRGDALESSVQKRLDLLIEAVGLVLLGLALPAKTAAASAATADARVTDIQPSAGREPRTAAQRFAELLIEDLVLYLRRERPQELAEGRRQGDWRKRFEPELERCRRAFHDRYPTNAEGKAEIFEEALQRLHVA